MRLLGAASFCVAGAALGASPARFAWQAQHLEHLRFVFCVAGAALGAPQVRFLRGRRSTWSTFIEVGGSLATSEAFGRRLVLRGRRSTWSISGSFCVAGAALGAPQVLLLRGRRSTWSTFIEVGGSLATSEAFGRRLVLRGRRSTWSISGSFSPLGASPHSEENVCFSLLLTVFLVRVHFFKFQNSKKRCTLPRKM